MTSEPEKWSSLEEIAKHLGVSKDTIRNWIKKVLFHIAELENSLNLEFLKLMHG